MTLEVESLGVKMEDLRALCEKWGVAKLSVFGSVARGEARPDSDIDLMVTFLPGRKPSLWGIVTMGDDFSAVLGRRVDLLIEGTVRNPFRLHSIERDLTPLYAA